RITRFSFLLLGAGTVSMFSLPLSFRDSGKGFGCNIFLRDQLDMGYLDIVKETWASQGEMVKHGATLLQLLSWAMYYINTIVKIKKKLHPNGKKR
ncbi:hypothetical protein ACJX0J_011497, partial [Zea mays]